MIMDKNYKFVCPKCGCEKLVVNTRVWVDSEIDRIDIEYISDESPHKMYYSCVPGDKVAEQPDECYGEVFMCSYCNREIWDLEEAITDGIITINEND